MAKKQKYYVVWQGHMPGVYTNWEDCQTQVKNFPNAMYKAYNTLNEAKEAYAHGPEKKSIRPVKTNKPIKSNGAIITPSISVDAACSGNPGAMEYRAVWTTDKSEIFHFGPVLHGTNNIGEFLAIVHALAMLKNQNDNSTPIYSDSLTAISWVKNKKAKTLLKQDKSTAKLFELIARAEKWLVNNKYKNPILKWETSSWGEIPADFGRK
jgi:ribonuclease HI